MAWVVKNSVWNSSNFDFMDGQSARAHTWTLLGGFLLIRALMVQSAHTISWSENPGIVCTDLVRPGLFVQNKSRILDSRDGDNCCCSRLKKFRISSSLEHILRSLAPVGTETFSQLISPALKSPETTTVEFGLFLVRVWMWFRDFSISRSWWSDLSEGVR